MANFLFEIGTEEIPARMIDPAREELARRVTDLLARERLSNGGAVEAYSTPRRLAVLARDIQPAQADVEDQILGPAASVAQKNPKAVEAFAKKAGVPVDQLERVTTPKGEYLSATVVKKGRPAADILAESLPREVSGLYWAKNMYWAAKPERFVRPVRWIVALLDGELVPVQVYGVGAGATTRGHRLLASDQVPISAADRYPEALAQGKVLSQDERERVIRRSLDAAARQAGGRWREDKELLNTVVNLTEFPSVILGSFEQEFLSLPEEVLVTVMRDHQKYFALEDSTGKLMPHFLAVLNTDSDPEGLIGHGNARVLRARFRDARFFWDTDQKTTLVQRVEMLRSVTFQKDLGSYHAKSERVVALVKKATDLEKKGVHFNMSAAVQAARLAKTDLTAELVKEFTELQGIVGGLYARAQGFDDAISLAIYDQYKPESMDDSVPRTIEGAIVSIADKADTVSGMFALGLQPTGSKDPFALRRQANGIVKTIAEHKLPVSLASLFQQAREGYNGSDAEAKFARNVDFTGSITAFFRERLEFYLRDVLGYAYDVVNAVLAAGSNDVVDAVDRANAVAAVRQSEDFESISVAFKRMKNILRQASESGKQVAPELDAGALQEDTEKELAANIPVVAADVRRFRMERNYTAALAEIAGLRRPIDTFFDRVMVMVNDERLRANRLALLRTLLNEFSTIADFSEIVTEKK
jgi:glycyl-tRNA synthetase beta chain